MYKNYNSVYLFSIVFSQESEEHFRVVLLCTEGRPSPYRATLLPREERGLLFLFIYDYILIIINALGACVWVFPSTGSCTLMAGMQQEGHQLEKHMGE